MFSPENCAFGSPHLDLIAKTLSALQKHVLGPCFIDTPVKGAEGCRFAWDEPRQHRRSGKHGVLSARAAGRETVPFEDQRAVSAASGEKGAERRVPRGPPAADLVWQHVAPTHGYPGCFHGRFRGQPCVLAFGRVIHKRLRGAGGWLVTADAISFLPHRPLQGWCERPRAATTPCVSQYITIEASSPLGAKTEHTLTKALPPQPPPRFAHTGRF